MADSSPSSRTISLSQINYAEDGDLQVIQTTTWNVLLAATIAYRVGRAALGERLAQQLISYYDRQPVSKWKALHLTVARGAQGDLKGSVEGLKAMYDQKYPALHYLRIYGLPDGRPEDFHGIPQNPEFKLRIDKLEAQRRDIVDNIRKECPELFV